MASGDSIPDKDFYVTMTDSAMSGWGRARGKDNKLVIGTDDGDEAEMLARAARRRSEMKYVNIATSKPRYGDDKYVSYKDSSEMTGSWRR